MIYSVPLLYCCCFLLLLSAKCALAFGPVPWGTASKPTTTTTTTTKTSGLYRSATTILKEKSESNNEMFEDDNFDNVDLIGVLGYRRLRRIQRRHAKELEDRIANFEVIQDESGNWVPATEEQKASMKAAAETAAAATEAAAKPKPKPKPKKESAKEISSVKDPLKIIIAGAPASGKGTQCEKIKEMFGVVHLSTGDMLRAAVAAESEVGKAAKEYMDAGKLVPDDVIIGVVNDRLMEGDCAECGWLLDGFPRTPAQADALAKAGISADCFLFLDVPDEILVERVVGRRTDPETGKIYHMTFSPPEDEEVAARLVQRSDDTEEKVKVRLEQFYANVEAVKDSYTDIRVNINGNASPDDVATAVAAAIKEKAGDKISA